MFSRISVIFTVFLAFILCFGCSHKIPDPASPIVIENDIPPTPENLAASPGDGFVALAWTVTDTSAGLTFRIYMGRYESAAINFGLIGQAAGKSYTADNLLNGNLYYFKVSSVGADGFEGYKSDSAYAMPDHFGFAINNGENFTRSIDVVLSMFAPDSTRLMLISEDSTFAGTQWEDYASSKSFRLSAGDGVKTVFCRFRDMMDRTTSDYIEDSIILDTQAIIDSVRFSPIGVPFMENDIIHFSLYPGEAGGQAAITIGDGILTISLYDDGLRGDAVSGDGIYETDYTVEGNFEFENQPVFGDFADRVGNIARQAVSNNTLTMRRAPDPVTIYSINIPDGYPDRLRLAWSISDAPDFAQYRIYKAESAGVDSTDTLIGTITSISSTSFTDTGLTENTQYFYRVFVLDVTGLWSRSNEVSATSGPNLPPEPVELYLPFATPGFYDRLELSWSESGENDFLRYELYRSDDVQVDSLDRIVFSSQSQTSYTDTGLEADSLYYYSVLTRDLAGNYSWSNVVGGRTNIDAPPQPVTLFPVIVLPDSYQSITIEWSQSTDSDFESYRLYRWREDLGRDDSLNVAIVTSSGTVTFDDAPPFDVAADTVNFWYILFVYDAGGNTAPSDSIRVHIVDNAPPTVSGSVESSTSSLIVAWIAPEIPDFASYHLLRDTDSNPDGAVAVYVSADQATISYDDASTTQGQTYYYWLDIYDLRNNVSRSALGSGSW